MYWLPMFVACLTLDFVYTRWVLHVTQQRRTRAALYSALCVLISYATTILCISDYWLVIPACAGHALGTVLAMGTPHEHRPPG